MSAEELWKKLEAERERLCAVGGGEVVMSWKGNEYALTVEPDATSSTGFRSRITMTAGYALEVIGEEWGSSYKHMSELE